MPSTNTGNLSETSMSLSWKSVDTESGNNTCSSTTFSNGNGINHFVLLEDLTDFDILLKVILAPLDLLFNSSTIDLDLHDVSLLLSVVSHLFDLGASEDSHS